MKARATGPEEGSDQRNSPRRWLELALGSVQLTVGTGWGLWSCYEIVEHNTGMAEIGPLYGIGMGLGAVALPGWFLVRGASNGWSWQLLPAMLALQVIVEHVRVKLLP
ncbi:MAG: hypothetical protein OXU20_18505 [Myxococcales bacterium]|nr:hypothetical protein [Myxococcales bacterium]